MMTRPGPSKSIVCRPCFYPPQGPALEINKARRLSGGSLFCLQLIRSGFEDILFVAGKSKK